MEKTILVIEDNSDNMALVEEILEDAGFRFIPATRAEDAIDHLRQRGGVDFIPFGSNTPKLASAFFGRFMLS